MVEAGDLVGTEGPVVSAAVLRVDVEMRFEEPDEGRRGGIQVDGRGRRCDGFNGGPRPFLAGIGIGQTGLGE